jgi:hypothetical protein
MKFLRVPNILLLAACSFILAAGQARQGQTPQNRPAPNRLSLRVVIYEGAAPTFYPVGDADKSVGSGLIRDFRRLPSAIWRNDTRVRSLLVSGSREGARVRVSVYAYGEDFAPGGLKLAEYLAGEGEEYAVTQLIGYGIEPLRVGVVRRAEVKLTPPRVDNRTRGVEVAAVDVHENVPSFEMTLRNVSDKKIRAVEIEEMRGWRPKGGPPLFDWKSRPPLRPGGVWKVTLEVGWNSKMTPEGHVIEPADRVVVASVLYTDGSYEGDSLFAAKAGAFEAGRRAQLARALEIMRATATGDAREDAREIASRVAALECVAEWSAVVEFAERYPAVYGHELDGIKDSLEEGMRWQRSFVAVELNGLVMSAATPNADPLALRERLKAMRAAFEQDLAGT